MNLKNNSLHEGTKFVEQILCAHGLQTSRLSENPHYTADYELTGLKLMFVYIYALFYRPIPVLPSGLATQSRAMCLGRSQVDIYGPCLQVVLFWVARVNRRGTGLLKPLIGHAQLLSSITSDYCSLYRKLCHDLNLNQS